MQNSFQGNFLEQSPPKGPGPYRNLGAQGYSSNFGTGQPPIDGNFLSENGQTGPQPYQDQGYASQQFGGAPG